ncbi:MAG: hypothetical protein ACKVX9_24665 [Blastocatellia bacterium]
MFAMTAIQRSISVSGFTRKMAGLISLAGLLTIPMMAGVVEQSRFEPGIRNGQGATRLTPGQLRDVAESIRSKAGFATIDFDENGWMRLGAISGTGSATAQKLLLDAFRRDQVIELHRRDKSSEVAFMQLTPQNTHIDFRTGAQITVYHLEIDFTDFAFLKGDHEARAAFDLGFILLHELTHGVRKIKDNNASQTRPGDCADYVNQIQKELGMAVRDHYFPEIRKYGGSISFARLNFSGINGDNKRYSLYWDAGKVGKIR